MIPEKLNNFDYNDKSFINKKNAAERANAIIAVSKNTKKDIIDIFKITPEKISVIPHGCSILDVEEKNIQFSINKPYVLFVGGRQTYKNFNITNVNPIGIKARSPDPMVARKCAIIFFIKYS